MGFFLLRFGGSSGSVLTTALATGSPPVGDGLAVPTAPPADADTAAALVAAGAAIDLQNAPPAARSAGKWKAAGGGGGGAPLRVLDVRIIKLEFSSWGRSSS